MAETVKLNLRLPPELHAAATDVAGSLGVSLNTFIRDAVLNWTDYQGKRLLRGRPAEYAIAHVADRERSAGLEQQGEVSRKTAAVPRVGANQPCPCGSGAKYKRCHGQP
jgi:hypothetical protein